MKHKGKLSVLLTISMLLTLFAVFQVPVMAPGPGETPFEKFGPRADNLVFNVYASPEFEYAGLDAGEIDYVDWISTKTWADTHNPAITGEAYYYERGLYQIDLNCNETFAPVNYLEPVYNTYLGKVNPTSDIWFRTALSYLADKDDYVTTILKGFGGAMDTPCGPSPSAGGPFLEFEDYYYDDPLGAIPYDPTKAANILDAHGWDDKEHDGIRNYPEALVAGRPNIHDYLGGGLVFVQRTDKPNWMAWSHKFAVEMQNIGIPVFEDSKDRMAAIYQVIVWLQYHLYAGGWSFGRDPTLFMKDIWYSGLYSGQGFVNMNYAHYNNSVFDEYAIKMYYATKLGTPGNLYDPPPAGEEGAYFYCQECQRMIKEEVPCIPLVYYMGPKGYYKTVTAPGAHQGETWTGMANERGYGINTWWTPLNMHPEGVEMSGFDINAGLSTDVESLNIVTAMMFYDYNILDSLFSGLTDYDPANPTFSGDIDLLAACHDYGLWDASSIMDPDLPGYPMATKMTYYLRPFAYWHDGTPITAEDIGFTIDFILACGPDVSWNWPALEYVDHYEITSPLEITIYCSAQSIYFPHLIGEFPYMPKHIWETVEDQYGKTYLDPSWNASVVYDIDVFASPEFLVGSGPYKWANDFVRNEYYKLTAFRNVFHLDEDDCGILDEPGWFYGGRVFFQSPPPEDWECLNPYPCYCSNCMAPYTLGIGHQGANVVFWLGNDGASSATVNINIDLHWSKPDYPAGCYKCVNSHECFQGVMVPPGCVEFKFEVPLPKPWVGAQVKIEVDYIKVTVYDTGWNLLAWSESVPGYKERSYLPGPVGDLTGPGWPPPTPLDGKVDHFDLWMLQAHYLYRLIAKPLPYEVCP